MVACCAHLQFSLESVLSCMNTRRACKRNATINKITPALPLQMMTSVLSGLTAVLTACVSTSLQVTRAPVTPDMPESFVSKVRVFLTVVYIQI